MFSTNQEPSSTSHTGGADSDRRATAPSQQHQQSSYGQQQQAGHGTGVTNASRNPQQPSTQQQQSRAATAEPYPSQDATWWEESHSPHPGRAEQGYGPGDRGGGGNRNMYEQQQYGQYGGRTRDDKRTHENQGVVNWNKVAKIVCAIFLPPLGVFLETGCDKSFAINLLLTILGYIPGIIHALYVIVTD